MATHAVESTLETSVPVRKRRVLPIIVVTTAALVLGAFAVTKWRFSQVHETTLSALTTSREPVRRQTSSGSSTQWAIISASAG